MNAYRRHGRPNRERGAALVLAILVLAILTVIGIALMLVTSTESQIAANEWSVNRAFYASDAGVRWAQSQLGAPNNFNPFRNRPEFVGSPFGTVLFQMPSWRHGAGGFFSGDPTGTDIQVTVQSPSLLGRRRVPGSCAQENDPNCLYSYLFELRATGGQNKAGTVGLQYSKSLVADVEMSPLPAVLP
ncbi:MAG TPA: pilus assembly PilX N-terminal domain-containing protein [Thermoanaerobaculia bacterium]